MSKQQKALQLRISVQNPEHTEADVGPLIPFWCESTFTDQKLGSFSGFHQKNEESHFYPTKQQKQTIQWNEQPRGRKNPTETESLASGWWKVPKVENKTSHPDGGGGA